MADGTHAVLDYKTSDKQTVKDWQGDRPNAPQLMLYATHSKHDISSVQFADLVPGATALRGYDGARIEAAATGVDSGRREPRRRLLSRRRRSGSQVRSEILRVLCSFTPCAASPKCAPLRTGGRSR